MPDEIQKGQEVVEQKPPEDLSASNETKDDSTLPEDASERTREQFEKLKQHNKDLSERLKALEEKENNPSIYETLKPQAPTAPLGSVPALSGLNINQTDSDVFSKLVDGEGYIDQTLLKKALKDAKDSADKAALEAQRVREELDRRTENEQVRTAHKEFPLLDPKSKDFDKKFYNAVRNEMVSQMINGEKDLVSAARKVAEWYPIPTSNKETPEQKQEQVRKANLTGATQSRTQSNTNDGDLVKRMWKGDRSALLERLKQSGY